MAIQFVQKFDSTNQIEDLPGAAGIGSVGGSLFARTSVGLMGLGPQQAGKSFFLDPANGSDANAGTTPSQAVATLAAALALCTAGDGDVVYLISDGATTATARLSAAFDWNKANTHLVGISSGVNISNRSRIAPTAAVASFANFFTVSAAGCLFQNIQWFHGFDAGAAAAICLTVSGGRNAFVNCHVAGMGSTDGADAQSTTSRNLKISGTGENQFINCTIGIDTVARTVANASVEFSGGAPRNVFKNCRFLMFATANTVLYGIVAAAAGSDRFQSFEDCTFINAIKSGSGTAITGAFTLAAAIGGLILLANPRSVGISTWGTDATSDAQIYVVGPAIGAGTGIGVNPTA